MAGRRGALLTPGRPPRSGMNAPENAYSLDPEAAHEDVLAAAAALFSTRKRSEGPVRETWYDTFDGRVRSAGGVLRSYRDGRVTRLSWKRARSVVPRESTTAQEPDFAHALPAGPVQEELAPVIEMRRLLPFVETERREVVLDVLDEERKTVARLVLEELRARPTGGRRWTSAPPVLRAQRLRGYDEPFARLQHFLEGTAGLSAESRDRPDRALDALGLEPPRDVGKLDVPLEPDMRADAGLRRILRALLETMLRNEAGVRADLDSEFLHDFRVAVRRTRSVLGQIKGVFPEPPLARFLKDFAWLGIVTGPTRDLDVFLLRLEDYERELGDVDLGKLRELLVRRQRAEHGRLVRALSSVRYRRLIEDWTAFLEDETVPEPEPKNAAKPVLRVFSRRIAKLYRRMTSHATDAPSAQLHELRLLGKKLRYLLDVSRNLYDPDAARRAVRELKRLQDVLGDFNDFVVQRETLARHAESLTKSGGGDAETLLAMGRVVERLRLRGDEARARFAKRFERFASRENRDRYRALFGSAGKAKK